MLSYGSAESSAGAGRWPPDAGSNGPVGRSHVHESDGDAVSEETRCWVELGLFAAWVLLQEWSERRALR
jgi:hypothetical protein